MLAIAAVFFAGMAAGGFLFAYTNQPPLKDGGKRHRRADVPACLADHAPETAAAYCSGSVVKNSG